MRIFKCKFFRGLVVVFYFKSPFCRCTRRKIGPYFCVSTYSVQWEITTWAFCRLRIYFWEYFDEIYIIVIHIRSSFKNLHFLRPNSCKLIDIFLACKKNNKSHSIRSKKKSAVKWNTFCHVLQEGKKFKRFQFWQKKKIGEKGKN